MVGEKDFENLRNEISGKLIAHAFIPLCFLFFKILLDIRDSLVSIKNAIENKRIS